MAAVSLFWDTNMAAVTSCETLYMVLGVAVTKLQRFVWIFNHVSRVITWSLFNFRALNLFKKPISTWPFIWWCQFIDWSEFETRPNSLRNSEMTNKARIFFPTACLSLVTSKSHDIQQWWWFPPIQEPLSSRVPGAEKEPEIRPLILRYFPIFGMPVELSSHLEGRSILNRTDNNSVGQEMNSHTHICKLGKASKPLLHFCIYFPCLKWMKPRLVLGWT